ncbi:hypothetical protein [Micromonospora sp. CPCC 205561]|uniref:hypothetical protein n=1 Tax=unclassified Micromonospora TaxID=2617518 RepID=UPI002FF102AC
MAHVTPQQLAQARAVGADAVLRNEVDFRGYPYRHLALVARAGFADNPVTQLLAAVEYLSQYGWELVNVTAASGSSQLYAFIRLR